MSGTNESPSASGGAAGPAEWMAMLAPMLRSFLRTVNYRPLWVVPIPFFVVVIGHLAGWPWVHSKYLYESVAVPIIGLATFLWLLRAWITRYPVAAIAAAQAFVFTCREIHFEGTSTGVYIATVIVMGWAGWWAWRRRQDISMAAVDWPSTSLLLATVVSYAVAILVQRRIFQLVPGESVLHIPLEEIYEDLAHVLFLLSALAGRWRRPKTGDAA